jgi:hypothetical protein
LHLRKIIYIRTLHTYAINEIYFGEIPACLFVKERQQMIISKHHLGSQALYMKEEPMPKRKELAAFIIGDKNLSRENFVTAVIAKQQ